MKNWDTNLKVYSLANTSKDGRFARRANLSAKVRPSVQLRGKRAGLIAKEPLKKWL